VFLKFFSALSDVQNRRHEHRSQFLLILASVLGGRVCRRCRRCGRRRRRRRIARIDPTGLYTCVKAVGGLRIDVAAVQDQAAERSLDMRAGAAEAVIEVEMAKGRVEVVPPQEPDYPPAQPNTFGIAGGPSDFLLRLGVFVDFLGFLGGLLAGGFFRRLLVFRKSLGREAQQRRGDQ
jgi:hypothetical protein